MFVQGFEVSILCETKKLEEYLVQPEGEGTISCYIPSEAGKNFAIHCINVDRHVTHGHTVSVRSIIDGRQAGGNVCRPGGSGLRSGVRIAVDQRQPFVFSDLVVMDDDSLSVEGPDQNVGLISVHIVRIIERKPVKFSPLPYSAVGPVHERSKKAGVHCVSLGPARECEPKCKVRVKDLDSDAGPFARFLFRYRPRALLQAQGIVPLSSTEPEHVDNTGRTGKCKERVADGRVGLQHQVEDQDVKPMINLTNDVEDLEVLEAQLHAIQNKIQKAKASRSGSQRIKTDQKLAISNSLGGDVIDLTLDD